jgi:hypothetical protein
LSKKQQTEEMTKSKLQGKDKFGLESHCAQEEGAREKVKRHKQKNKGEAGRSAGGSKGGQIDCTSKTSS